MRTVTSRQRRCGSGPRPTPSRAARPRFSSTSSPRTCCVCLAREDPLMTLTLTDDQLMFRDAARRFAAERAPVSQLRKLRDDDDPIGFNRQVWKEMAETGWAGVLMPEEYGGVGFGFVGAGLLATEIGRNL